MGVSQSTVSKTDRFVIRKILENVHAWIQFPSSVNKMVTSQEQ